MRRVLGALLMLVCSTVLHAETLQPADPVAWLQKVANAAHQLNYAGTFVYQHGGQVETSRVTHRFDESGEQEKLEALDGPLREIIRNNNEVLCYYADSSKTVKVEKRHAQKYFPALLPAQSGELAENYTVKLGEQERVAGYDCQAIILEPKDAMRYGHKFWADIATGLLLKASVVDDKGQVLHQFAFTEVSIGGQIDKERLKPHLSARKLLHADPAAVSQARLSETGWDVRLPPAGFKKIMELQRSMPGRKGPVAHLVLSDGLAAISVFIEPLAGQTKPMEGVFAQGPINVYARPVDNHQVTVLGEVPSGAVMQVANSVVPKAK